MNKNIKNISILFIILILALNSNVNIIAMTTGFATEELDYENNKRFI